MIIGIGGASRSGKSTLARMLVNYYRDSGKTAITLCQDDFVFPTAEIPKVRDKVDWEHPGSINHSLLREVVDYYSSKFEVVIVDGFLAFYDELLNSRYDYRFFVSIKREVFFERKQMDLRWGYIPPWFIAHIWESYLAYGIPNFSKYSYIAISGEKEYQLEMLLPLIGVIK